MGSLFRPKYPPPGQTYKSAKAAGTLIESRIWWVKYYVHGRSVREGTDTDNWTEAQRFLKKREGAVATEQPILPRVDRVRYEELAADLRAHYETTGCRDLEEADGRFAHLTAFFAGRRVVTIGQAEATAYVAQRQTQGAANGTINRELAVLIRMLRLGYELGKVLRLPVIRKLKEAGPRQGFFEREQYAAVRKHLPPDLQVAVAIAYAFGWRMQSEVLTRERRHLDLDAGTLRLDPGTTKNDDGRVVYLPADLQAQLATQVDGARALERKLGRVIPYLFPHSAAPGRGLAAGTFARCGRRR
jgi:integrase